jgi:hypothetical protein
MTRCPTSPKSATAKYARQTLAAAYPLGADSPELKTLLKVELYPYQREGALFAARAGRALIGDEMGLGKTVQAIAAVEIFARHFAAERVLIVCPTSLKHQWEREIARFSDRQRDGHRRSARVRQARYAQDDFCKITNYETLSRDLDLIQAWAPDVVIVDEAQRIKNWNTIAARALKRIDSPYAIVLTGTPLENRLEELISIVQFVDQYRLGPTWRLLDEHQQRDERGRVIGYRELHRIGETLAPIMLRRRKAEVLEQLPERVDNTLFMPMSPLQADHHEENRQVVARIVQRWRHTGFLSDKDQLRMHCSLQNMRMACNSSFLIDHETDDGYKADELALLDDILADPQAKVVVFSQWLRTHELIIRRLASAAGNTCCSTAAFPATSVARSSTASTTTRLPPVSQHRRRRRRPQPATRGSGGGEHGSAVESGGARTTHRSRAPPRPDARRAGDQLRRPGTIEEGMLSVLAFKQSLFAGVLDGGESEVVLQGTRLSKFMEARSRPSKRTPRRSKPRPAPPATATAPGAADPWAPLLAAGAQLLGELSAASSGERASPWVQTDPATGERYLKLPMPDPQTIQRLAEGLLGLLGGRK